MKLKSIISLLLLLCLTFSALALSSCKKDEAPPADGGESQSESEAETEAPEVFLDLVVAGKSDYVIIVPEDCDDRIVSAAQNLIKNLKNFTGATVKYDFDMLLDGETADADAKEILIGLTNRPESAAAIAGLTETDYFVGVQDNKMIICGGEGDAQTTVSAVDYFITNIIQKNFSFGTTDGSLSFGSKQNYVKMESSTVYIESCTVLGKNIADCTVVYPDGGYAEEYVALLLKHHMKGYAKIDLRVVSDAEKVEGVMVLIGKTKYNTLAPSRGKYKMEVTDKGFEVVADSPEGYADAHIRLQTEVFKYSQKNIALEKGQKWEGNTCTPANIKNDSDLRIMYHNVFSYSGQPSANRYKLAAQMYKTYMPDVIGFQEAASASFGVVEDTLSSIGYDHRKDTRGSNAVWYNTNTVELLAWGTDKGASGGYQQVWCIFKLKETGKVFGFINCHYIADSMTTTGGTDRTKDAQAMIRMANTILNHEKGGADLTVFAGGDLNSTPTTEAYQTLIRNGDFTNVRGLATVCTELQPYHWGFDYIESEGVFVLPAANTTKNTGTNAIDHVFLAGNKLGANVDEYAVISSPIPSVISDHSPHFLDISFSDVVYEPFGPSTELPFPNNG